MSEIYDVIILGAGPAGLAAGLYAGRSRLNVLIIEKGQDGGQIAITDEIENYPGQIVEGESGPCLIARRIISSNGKSSQWNFNAFAPNVFASTISLPAEIYCL